MERRLDANDVFGYADALWCIECDNCGEIIKRDDPQQCPECHATYYCNYMCQFRHYWAHKPTCATMKKDLRNTSAAFENHFCVQPQSSCIVCFDDIKNEERLQIPGCNHEFCYECLRIYQLHTIRATCPMCRGYLPEDLSLNFFEEAEKVFSDAKHHPKHSELHLSGIEVVKKRVSLLLKVEPWHENAWRWHTLQATVLSHVGQHEDAIAILDKLGKDETESYSNLSEFKFLEVTLMAHCKLSIGDPRRAKALLLSLKANKRLREEVISPKNTEACQQMHADLARSLYECAMLEIADNDQTSGHKDLKRTISTCNDALEMNRHCSGIYEYLSLAHEALRNFVEAAQALKRAVAYETPWDHDKANDNRKKLKDLMIRAMKAKEQAEKEKAEREAEKKRRAAQKKAEGKRRRAAAAREREEAERKKAEFALARAEWRKEKKKAMVEAEAEDMKAGRIRLADLDEEDEFYSDKRSKKKGKKGKKERKGRKNKVGEVAAAPGDQLSETAAASYEVREERHANEDESRSWQDTNEEEQVKEEDEEVWRCLCCRKDFKSEQQFENHLQSKKHKQRMRHVQQSANTN